MHRAAGDVASKTERSWLVSNEGQCLGLTWIGFDGNIIAIHVQTVHDICADEFYGYDVATVDSKRRRRISILMRINLKETLLRYRTWNR